MTFNEWWYDYTIKNGKRLPSATIAKAAWDAAMSNLARQGDNQPDKALPPEVERFEKIGFLQRPMRGTVGVVFVQKAESIPLGLHEILDVYMLREPQSSEDK